MRLIRNPVLAATTALIIGIAVGLTTGAQANSETRLPIDEVRLMSQVLERIKQSYVEEVTDEELIEAAIEGMLRGLDPHSDYLTPDDFADLRESTSGEFGGLGIEITLDETGFVRVVSPIDDTPAYKAGMQSGDLITQIDDTPVKGMTINDAVNLMRGEPGTDIELTVLREGESGPLTVEITRDIIKITSIRHRMLEPDFGYIRISAFQERTGNDFEDAIKALNDETENGLKGLVLDLRNNPGGVLQASVAVVDALIDEGLIVYTEGRISNSDSRFVAHSDDPSNGVNLVVLINGGSASASEIVAGAIQDHKRGLILGTRSFGKGSVQTILPLSQDHALKLTTARYFTPSGRSIQAQGIEPDIIIRQGSLTQNQNDPFYKEADLAGALDNPNGDADSDSKATAESTQKAEAELAEDDYQLYQALTVLKGISILNASR
ncbi:S41 family peptidase [Reinekea marinisedimentorum]|uniref:Carboxyl-terminal processing protease n=1 Tax=Reinekea marinisedimentorum TaxID=230495 RepID=A0A4R3I9E4_9GAMM|nr:S41 family peptidase [Reinekea marinisedimentorum]TCS43008.1 carboxyl-terminal processing protease [Reinekea marinisedimentorum]